MQYELEFQDTFEDEVLDRDRWLPYYLPHWSSRERAAARYAIGGGCLRLMIEAEQQPWCPEYDGGVRVSSLQNGAFAGPVDRVVGQHRFNPAARVREAQSSTCLYTAQYARLELRAKASDDPRVDPGSSAAATPASSPAAPPQFTIKKGIAGTASITAIDRAGNWSAPLMLTLTRKGSARARR